MKKFNDKQILKGTKLILEGVGLDLKDPNFIETPERILRSYYEICGGLIDKKRKIKKILSKSFPTEYDGLVLEGPIKCYSICPHHFLPVIYEVFVGYISTEKGLGLSKLPRLVELLAQEPKFQEDFTKEIVDILKKNIKPAGVMVVVKGNHLCMQMRGVKKPNCPTTTSSFIGAFSNSEAREEFLNLIKK